jgi:hypothetical protein
MSRWRDPWWAVTLGVLVLALFVATLRLDVGGTEDSAKFQFVGRVLGTAHSPGYPLYVVLTWLFSHLPIGTLAVRINLFSAVWGAVACAFVFLIAREIRVSQWLAAVGALAAATTGAIWRNAIVAEVYTLGAALAAMTVWLLLAWSRTGERRWLFAACAVFAAALGNHLTIIGVLPAAVLFAVARDRSVLSPKVVMIVAVIGLAGVAQYGFIALRTIQGAPYLEARAASVRGTIDVITARDQSWARFQLGPREIMTQQVPMVARALQSEIGIAGLLLAAIGVSAAVARHRSGDLLVAGATAGLLALVVNLQGDVSGFLASAICLIWPLAMSGAELAAGAAGPVLVGLAVFAMPAANIAANRGPVAQLLNTDDMIAMRQMYARLPAGAAVMADDYWTARVIDYFRFSGEVSPNPDPAVLVSAEDLGRAVGAGRAVFAPARAAPWLAAQGFRFERSPIATAPMAPWLARQPAGSLVVMAVAGRVLPFEWLPGTHLAAGMRPSAFAAAAWSVGETAVEVVQGDTGARIRRNLGGQPVTVVADDAGIVIASGDDLLGAIDRGLAIAVLAPDGRLLGRWAFGPAEDAGLVLAPAFSTFKEQLSCVSLRAGESTNVTPQLARGGWIAMLDRPGTATVRLTVTGSAVLQARVVDGDGGARLQPIEPGASTLALTSRHDGRAVFALDAIGSVDGAIAQVEPGSTAGVLACESRMPLLPATGALESGGNGERWYGEGWHATERDGDQRFRWAARAATLWLPVPAPSAVRVTLRVSAANRNGTTLRFEWNGRPVATCAVPAGTWTDCQATIAAADVVPGINAARILADSILEPEARHAETRELAFKIQGAWIRFGA